MIDEIHVRDVALIHDATIRPAPGLTVLTGETGAGKTALLNAVKLLMGERADAHAVREGARELVVEGRFFLPGDESEEGCVVRRRVGTDGRGRAQIDGAMASVRELGQRVGSTIDLVGQNAHQQLMSPHTHQKLLDAWAGEAVTEALEPYRVARVDVARAKAEITRVHEAARVGAQRLDEARFALRRIDEVDPKEGEYEELEERLALAEHGEALMQAAEGARELLAGDGGAADAISDAMRALSAAERHDQALGSLSEQLQGALVEVEDVASELRDYADRLDFDPDALAAAQERMAQLEGLKRTYGPRMLDVFRTRERSHTIVEAWEEGDELERQGREKLHEAEDRLGEVAHHLHDVREEAAPRLAAAVTEQMARLQMGTASLEVTVEPQQRDEWGKTGPDVVEFLYKPGAGLTARPLRKIASGGETSRVLLACKVALGPTDGCDTLVFDEVDAGVGGATAVALAEVLSDLARDHQVIVVTHLAQVAVVAERHYLVSKSEGDEPQTSISLIEGEERVAEVARMLSGDAADEASLELARSMLGRAAVAG